MTEVVDLSVFKECRDQLKYDEFIVDKKSLSMKLTMNALTVGSPRIDAHRIADGIHSFRDLESHGIAVPNENASVEEIGQIQGYLFDCLVSRLDGNSTLQSIGLSAYVHKGFEFKSELLRLVSLCHVSLVDAVQVFAKEKFVLSTTLWIMDQDEESCSFLPEFSVEELRKQVSEAAASGAEKILEFAKFELEFGEFLRGKCELPKLVELPVASKELGASKFIHYRDLSVTAPPPATLMPTHEEAVQKFTTMYGEVSELLNYPKSATIYETFKGVYEWQQSHPDLLAFTRLFLFSRVIPDLQKQAIFDTDFDKMISDEFTAMRVPLKAFHVDQAMDYKKDLFSFCLQIIRGFVCPPCITHQNLVKTGLRFWWIVEKYTVRVEGQVAKFASYAKTNSDAMNSVVATPLSHWARRIGVFLTLSYLKYELENEVLNANDYAGLFMSFVSTYKCLMGVIESERTIELVYKHLPPKKQGKKRIVRSLDVSRDLAVKTYEELEAELLVHFYEGAFHFMRFCAKTDSMKFNKGMFYDQERTYMSRRKPLSESYPPITIPYANFHILYDVTNTTPEKLKADVTKAWGLAKTVVSKAVEVKGEKTPFLTNLLKTIVMSSIALSKWQEGQMFVVKFEGAIPCFQIQQ